jgi:hypothetical protein
MAKHASAAVSATGYLCCEMMATVSMFLVDTPRQNKTHFNLRGLDSAGL